MRRFLNSKFLKFVFHIRADKLPVMQHSNNWKTQFQNGRFIVNQFTKNI